ncbi:MAG TPA: hypothetical protein VK081_12785 [Planctomycetota bacterium]|nr:hypothetical protein [Planctomycetota bacterium]
MRPYRPSPHRRRAPGLLSAGVLVSAFAFAACNAAPGSGSAPGRTHGGAPLWAARGISDAHPDLAWLHAVGSAPVEGDEAEARARAELDARGKIMRNLVSKVRAEVVARESFWADDSSSRTESALDQTVAVVSEGTLEGARPVDFYVDPEANLAHCLLVLERAPAAREVARRIDEKEADAAALLARSRNAPPSIALPALAQAYDAVVAARVLRCSYAVLAHGPLTRPDRVGEEVIANLHALAASLQLRVEAGNGQRGRVGGEIEAPIVFALSADGEGVEGVELVFRLRGHARAELSPPRKATGPGGMAAVVARALGASGERSNQIEAVVEVLDSRGLPGPVAIAEYLLPTPADTRVLVGTTATAHGAPADPGALHAGVVAALGGAGFAVVAPEQVAEKASAHDVVTLAVPELCARLRGRVDYVVRVLGAAKEASARQDKMRARASAVVLLIDVATGQVDQFLSDPADGLADTHAQAADTSLARLGDGLGRTVVERLRARAGV